MASYCGEAVVDTRIMARHGTKAVRYIGFFGTEMPDWNLSRACKMYRVKGTARKA